MQQGNPLMIDLSRWFVGLMLLAATPAVAQDVFSNLTPGNRGAADNPNMKGDPPLVADIYRNRWQNRARQNGDVYASRTQHCLSILDVAATHERTRLALIRQARFSGRGAEQQIDQENRIINQLLARFDSCEMQGGVYPKTATDDPHSYTSFYSRDQFNGGSPPPGARLPGDGLPTIIRPSRLPTSGQPAIIRPPGGLSAPRISGLPSAQSNKLGRQFAKMNNSPEALIRNGYADATGQRRIVFGPQESNNGMNVGFGKTYKPQRQFNGYANGERSRANRRAPARPLPRRPGSMIGKATP